MKAAITQMATVTDQAIFGSGTGGYSRRGPMTPAVTLAQSIPPAVPAPRR